eukprot:595325-Amphidinium_carterae.1
MKCDIQLVVCGWIGISGSVSVVCPFVHLSPWHSNEDVDKTTRLSSVWSCVVGSVALWTVGSSLRTHVV